MKKIIVKIIIGVISVLVSITSAILMYNYNTRGVTESASFTISFASNQQIGQVETSTRWAKGQVQYGLNQLSGVTKTRYSMLFCRVGSAWVTQFDNGYLEKNNTYYGPWNIMYATGKHDYSYRLLRKTNLNTSSKMHIDLFKQ